MLTKITIVMFAFMSVSVAQKYTLDVLCDKGINNNPKISSFKHKTSASHSAYDQAFDRYKPSLSVGGRFGVQDYSYSGNTEYSGNTYSYRASIDQVLYRASLGHGLDDSEKRIALAKLQESDEKAKLITQILQNVFELVKLQKTTELYVKKESILAKAYSNIKKGHALKLASKVDTFQALSRLQQARSDLARVKHLYRQTLFNLKLLTKQEKAQKYTTNLKLNIASIEKTYRDLNLIAVKTQYHQSTRVKLDRQVANIAKGQIDLRASDRYPSVSLSLSAGDAGGTLDNFTRQNETSAVVNVDFPLYQGGYITDRTEEARFLYLAAMDEAENTEMSVKISLEKSLQDIASGLESAKADAITVKASKNYLDATMKSYKSGLGSLTDVYLAEAEYHDSEVRHIRSKGDIFRALAEVYYFTGTADVENVKKLYKKHLQ